jgi:putative ATPase
MSDLFQAAGLTPHAPTPLAERLRPQTLDEVVGQEHLLGPEGPIGRMAAAQRLSSMILWGPPGTGKTTIARLLAKAGGYEFQQISAVFSGVADLKKAFEQARGRRMAGQSTCCSSTRSTASTAPSRTVSCRSWRRGSSPWSAPPPRTPRSS